MIRRGSRASRCLVPQTIGFERLEDRWLLSAIGALSAPTAVGLTVERLAFPLIVERASIAAAPDVHILESSQAVFSAGVEAEVSGTVTSSMTNPTPPVAVVVTDPGDNTSYAPDTRAEDVVVAASSISGANEFQAQPPAIFVPAPPPGPPLSSVTLLAGANGMVRSTGNTASRSLQGEMSSGTVAVFPPASAWPLMSIAAPAGSGATNAGNVTFSATGDGNVFLSDGFIATTEAITTSTLAVMFNPVELTIPGSSTTVAVAMPAALVFLTPLDTATTNGYGRMTAPGAE